MRSIKDGCTRRWAWRRRSAATSLSGSAAEPLPAEQTPAQETIQIDYRPWLASERRRFLQSLQTTAVGVTDEAREPSAEEMSRVHGSIARQIVSWNLCDPRGRPVPVSARALADGDPALSAGLLLELLSLSESAAEPLRARDESAPRESSPVGGDREAAACGVGDWLWNLAWRRQRELEQEEQAREKNCDRACCCGCSTRSTPVARVRIVNGGCLMTGREVWSAVAMGDRCCDRRGSRRRARLIGTRQGSPRAVRRDGRMRVDAAGVRGTG